MAQRKILLYGQFGEDWWTGEGITAQSFMADLAQCNADDDCDEILVCINSPGGSVFEGTAIFNAIREQNGREEAKPIYTRNDGFAYSMGAVVLLAGKERRAFKNSMMMLHNASGGAYGNVRRMESAISQLNGVDANLANILSRVTQKSDEEVRSNYLDYQDHFYTAQEAENEGLVNQIEDAESEDVQAVANYHDVKAVVAHFAKQYAPRNQQETSILRSLQQRILSILPEAQNKPKGTPPTTKPELNKPKMLKLKNSFGALLSFFNVEAKEGEAVELEPTDDQLTNLNAKLVDLEAKQQEIADAKAENERLQARIAELENGTGADPNRGSGSDATGDGGESETYLSEADAQLQEMKSSYEYPKS